MTDRRIQAAGGVVIRRKKNGSIRVLLAHRPRYDDWSLPKGKADPGETPEETALREVEEETGVRCRIIAPLGEMEYDTTNGNPKVVRWFAMRPLEQTPFEPNEEVDQIEWLSPEKARKKATYEADARLLDLDYDTLLSRATVWLVRHAAAGDRSAWSGDDRVRPLTRKGWAQADAIAAALAPLGVDEIHSSIYDRCRQTVEPLARTVGLSIHDNDVLTEGARGTDTLDWIASMAGASVAACSHGDVIPEVIRALDRRGVELRSETGVFDVKKASTWTLAVEAGIVVSATYRPPPSV